ncbi:MAG: DUF2155 domain-containing protein [Alphaproteobacteria bacterium]|nr:DUF2155 domain-containing protein [Alphaproteobacteria bacterium]
MNKLSKISFCLSMSLAFVSKSFAGDIVMNTAHIQAMDKITGRVSELNIPVNGLANFGTFSILVRKCVTKSPEETPENTAFIDVVDNYQSENPVNIFKGWMFSSTPGINSVEHPIYDIWLLKCYNSDKSKHQVLTEEQLKFRDELPMVRQEKQEQNIKLSAVDEDIDDQDIKEIIATEQTKEASSSTEAKKEETKEDEIIKIDVDSNPLDQAPADNETEAEVAEDDFIAEGEEIIADTIVVDNETVAQDEEQQKAKEEAQSTEETTEEEVVVDEITE